MKTEKELLEFLTIPRGLVSVSEFLDRSTLSTRQVLKDLERVGEVIGGGDGFWVRKRNTVPMPPKFEQQMWEHIPFDRPWKSRDGTLTKVEDMNDGHVVNSVLFAIRKKAFGWAIRLAGELERRGVAAASTLPPKFTRKDLMRAAFNMASAAWAANENGSIFKATSVGFDGKTLKIVFKSSVFGRIVKIEIFDAFGEKILTTHELNAQTVGAFGSLVVELQLPQ